MAAENSVKLANMGVEMFRMGLSFQEALPCAPPGGLQRPLDASCKVHLLRCLKVTRLEKSHSYKFSKLGRSALKLINYRFLCSK